MSKKILKVNKFLLRRRCLECGLTQADLARKCRVSPPQISKFANNTGVSRPLRRKVPTVLKCTLWDLSQEAFEQNERSIG